MEHLHQRGTRDTLKENKLDLSIKQAHRLSYIDQPSDPNIED